MLSAIRLFTGQEAVCRPKMAGIRRRVGTGAWRKGDGMAASARSSEIATLIQVLEVLRRLDPDMPIQYALSFLTVAQNEGLSIRELSERLGIAQSSASRNVAALSRWRGPGKPGHDLVLSEEDPRERRRKVVTLTAEGRALVEELGDLLARTPQRRSRTA